MTPQDPHTTNKDFLILLTNIRYFLKDKMRDAHDRIIPPTHNPCWRLKNCDINFDIATTAINLFAFPDMQVKQFYNVAVYRIYAKMLGSTPYIRVEKACKHFDMPITDNIGQTLVEEAREVKCGIADIGPQAEGFDHEDSISTISSTTSNTAPQEAVDSQGAIALVVAEEDSSKDTEGEEEEGEDDDDADARQSIAPYAPSPSTPTSTSAAATIPTDTMDKMAYEVVADDATLDSTSVEKEREVAVEDDNSSPSYDDGKGTSEEEQEKQKGKQDS
jgi:hypothetical protein